MQWYPQLLLRPAVLAAMTVLAGCGNGDSAWLDSAAQPTGANASPLIARSLAASSSSFAPVVFNYSATAQPGDVIFVQGAHLAGATVVLTYNLTRSLTLPVLNSYTDAAGNTELSVELPTMAQIPGLNAASALSLRLSTSGGNSANLPINAAQPYHLDATALAPGAPFRLMGRNLLLNGVTPVVTFEQTSVGQGGTTTAVSIASLNLSGSTEHRLVGLVPANLIPNLPTTVLVSNGNGSDASTMVQQISIMPGSSADPFGLAVGWGSSFVTIAATMIDPTSDAHVFPHMIADGVTDNSAALQSAIIYANSLAGGATVQIPPGTYLIGGAGVEQLSNVVIRGAGIGKTTLNYILPGSPLYSKYHHCLGLMDLTLSTSTSTAPPEWLFNTNLFIKNVEMIKDVPVTASNNNAGWVAIVSSNTDVLIADSTFANVALSAVNAIDAVQNKGLVMTGNSIQYPNGTAVAIDASQNVYYAHNHIIRNAAAQNIASTFGAAHGLTINFVKHLTIDANYWSVINGPLTNYARNDGEAILTEGGGPERTEAAGIVTAADALSLSDTVSTKMLNTSHLQLVGNTQAPVNYSVVIIAGTGTGQSRDIVGASQQQITIDRPWDVIPDTGSHYATFVAGIEDAIISNNVFDGWPVGTLIYDAASNHVDIINNQYSEGGGIWLRSCDELFAGYRRFDPLLNINVVGNSVTNTLGQWGSYIGNMFVMGGHGQPFGFGSLGISFRNNIVRANASPVDWLPGLFGFGEGFFNEMSFQVANTSYVPGVTAGVIGTIFQKNTCFNCVVPVQTGTNVAATDYIATLLIHSLLPVHQDTQLAPGPEGVGSQLDYVSTCPAGYRQQISSGVRRCINLYGKQGASQ